MSARELPLGPQGPPRYTVWFAPELENELFDHPNAEELIDELSNTLSMESAQISGRRTEKIQGTQNLWKYRPHSANDVRFIYARESHYVVVLAVFPRSTDYRSKDLRTANKRRETFIESTMEHAAFERTDEDETR